MKPGSTVAGNVQDGVLKWMGGGSFEGSVKLMNGRFDRRRFLVENTAKRVSEARRDWEKWKAEVRQEERQKMRERAHGKDDRDAPTEKMTAKEGAANMAATKSGKTDTHIGNVTDRTYVVMVVGGAPIFVVENFEDAASICDALTAGAEASGFAAKYDVVEVKRWSI